MLELEELFGSRIPDVEFVLATSDRPMVLLNASAGRKKREGPPPPVLRFCSSPAHADIQVGGGRFVRGGGSSSSGSGGPAGKRGR
eukprot:360327-Chlamydomonas_euryale.AAC.1